MVTGTDSIQYTTSDLVQRPVIKMWNKVIIRSYWFQTITLFSFYLTKLQHTPCHNNHISQRTAGLSLWDLFSKLCKLSDFVPLKTAAWSGTCAAISLQFQPLNPYLSQPYLPSSPLQNHIA